MRIDFPFTSRSPSDRTFRLSSVVVPKSYSCENFIPGSRTLSNLTFILLSPEFQNEPEAISASDEYETPAISNALRCPQHSSQVFLNNLSRSPSVACVGASRYIQYSGIR